MPFNLGLESTRLESIKHMGGGWGMGCVGMVVVVVRK